MPSSSGGGGLLSPYTYNGLDNYGKSIYIEVPFDTVTGELQNGFVRRDPDCQWNKIYVGLGADGSVETTEKVFVVPEGTHTLRAATLASRGLSTIAELYALQITAGP